MENHLLKPGCWITAVLILAALPVGCTKNAPQKTDASQTTEARKPLEPITGQSAFNQMYRPVRNWASDALPLTLTSSEIPDVKCEDGHSAMWTGVFVSPSAREARTAFFSSVDHAGIPQGVTLAGDQGWSGATAKSKPFDPTVLFVDSDQAYKTAFGKAEPWVKKHPDKKPSLYLAAASQSEDPVWVVMWGDTKSGYLSYINGATGRVMATR